MRQNLAKIFTLLLIAWLAIFIYTINLVNIPTSIHGDEGETALQAINILNGKMDLIGVGWYDLPLLAFVPHLVTMLIFGQNIIGDRLGSVIFGLLTLPIFYLFVKLILTKRIAVIATILLGTSHMWIALSRLGITYVQATFLMMCTLYFLFKGIESEKKKYFIIAGTFFGLSFYSYYAIRILPFIILPNIIIYLLKKPFKRKVFHAIIFLFAAIICFAPQGLFFLNHQEAFTSRTKMVYIFSDVGKQWTNYKGNDFDVIFKQTQKTLNIFEGDNSTQYGYQGQLIDYLSLVFLFAGIFFTIKFFSLKKLFLFIWLFLSLFGQIFTTVPTPIFLPRFVIGLPILYLFIAIGINTFLQYVKNQNAKLITSAFIITAITTFNLYTYFYLYPKQAVGDLNARAATNISNYLNSLSPSYKALFITAPRLYANFGTLNFASPTINRIDVQKISPDIQENKVLGSSTNKVNKVVYILYPEYMSELEKLKNFYPQGEVLDVKDIDGNIQFYIFKE